MFCFSCGFSIAIRTHVKSFPVNARMQFFLTCHVVPGFRHCRDTADYRPDNALWKEMKRVDVFCEVCGWKGKLVQLEVSGFILFLLKKLCVRVRRQQSEPSRPPLFAWAHTARYETGIACMRGRFRYSARTTSLLTSNIRHYAMMREGGMPSCLRNTRVKVSKSNPPNLICFPPPFKCQFSGC